MHNLNTDVSFQYFDYLLFIFSLSFLGISLFIFLLKKQRNLWMKENNLIFIIVFFFITGLGISIDLFIYVFNNNQVIFNLHFFLYLLSYIFLFEFGRRLLFNNKRSLLLYFFIIIIFLFDIPTNIGTAIFAFTGTIMAGIGIRRWFILGKIITKSNNLLIKLLYSSLILLAFTYIVFIFGYSFFDNYSIASQAHWTRHFIQWSIQVFFGIALIYNIMTIRIKNQFDYQLKEILIKLTKKYILIILSIIIISFLIVYGFGKVVWIDDKKDILYNGETIALMLSKSVENLFSINGKDDISFYSLRLQQEIQKFEEQKKRISNIDILFYQNDQILNGISSQSSSSDLKNNYLKEYTNTSPLMFKAIEDGETLIEEYVNKEKNENWISSYTPIYNDFDEPIALLKIDYKKESTLNNITKNRFIGILLVFGVILIILLLAPIEYYYKREKIWLNNYESILSSLEELICIFDKDGNIIYSNNAMKIISNLSFNKINLNSPNILKYLFDIYTTKGYFNKLLINIANEGSFNDEIEIQTTNKTTIVLAINVKPLSLYSNSPLYVFVGNDITDQKNRINDLQQHFETTLALLATVVDAKDRYTSKHSSNVAQHAEGIAKALNFSKEKVEEIKRASLLHDIGKIYIPDYILKKTGPLKDEEWLIMKKHSEYGRLILEKGGDTLKPLIPYIYHHHERYDGKGYPTGMKEPSLDISIVTLADSFDAMISDRSYRKGMSIELAKEEIIKNAGVQFHPEAVNGFIKYINNNEYNNE